MKKLQRGHPDETDSELSEKTSRRFSAFYFFPDDGSGGRFVTADVYVLYRGSGHQKCRYKADFILRCNHARHCSDRGFLCRHAKSLCKPHFADDRQGTAPRPVPSRTASVYGKHRQAEALVHYYPYYERCGADTGFH